MIWACQTNAMDMALITIRQTIRATPRCDSRISLRKTRRIHSMVGVLLVLLPASRRGLDACTLNYSNRSATQWASPKTTHSSENKTFVRGQAVIFRQSANWGCANFVLNCAILFSSASGFWNHALEHLVPD